MKIYAWILGSFSVLATLGILMEASHNSGSYPGLIYGIAVSIFCFLYIGSANKKD